MEKSSERKLAEKLADIINQELDRLALEEKKMEEEIAEERREVDELDAVCNHFHRTYGREFVLVFFDDTISEHFHYHEAHPMEKLFHRYGFIEKMIYVRHDIDVDAEEKHYYVYIRCDETLSMAEISEIFHLYYDEVSLLKGSVANMMSCFLHKGLGKQLYPDSALHILVR
jgi:beta-xylosidase